MFEVESWKVAAGRQKEHHRAGYRGLYAVFKQSDPYDMDVFNHSDGRVEVWNDLERDLWIE